MAEEALGPKNPHTVIIIAQPAYISCVQGQEIGAVFLMRRVLSLQDEVLDSEHPHTIHNRVILGEWETALCKNSSCAVPFRRRHEGQGHDDEDVPQNWPGEDRSSPNERSSAYFGDQEGESFLAEPLPPTLH
jgi:hypothetical protein